MSSPLTEDQILLIRKLRKEGKSPRQISARIFVDPSTVRIYTTGAKGEADPIGWMPAWNYTGWELRALKIKEGKR